LDHHQNITDWPLEYVLPIKMLIKICSQLTQKFSEQSWTQKCNTHLAEITQ